VRASSRQECDSALVHDIVSPVAADDPDVPFEDHHHLVLLVLDVQRRTERGWHEELDALAR